MTFDELPEWIRNSMTAIGVDKRDFDGGLIEVEFWLQVIAAEDAKHSANAKSLAEAVGRYREQMNMIGAATMMQTMMDKTGRH